MPMDREGTGEGEGDRLAIRAVRAEMSGVAPRLRDAPIALLGEGIYCRAYLVGDDLVFRFPRDRKGAAGRT